MVALGNNRNNGLNLGPWYINANNALSNSNGNNWRSRPYLNAPVERRRFGVRTESVTPHKAVGSRRHIQWQRDAVKEMCEESVSRARA